MLTTVEPGLLQEPSIVVDRSRGEKLVVNLNVSFPRVPCYCECCYRGRRTLARELNATCSIKRGHHGHFWGAPKWYALRNRRSSRQGGKLTSALARSRKDVNHDMSKTRLSKDGVAVEAPKGKELKGDLERIATQKGEGYCRSLLLVTGATEADDRSPGGTCYGGTPPESGCCNTCEEVREAYVRRGWSFVNPDSVEQVRPCLLILRTKV